jgi:Protein of unknown function (DUF3500)
MKKLKNSFSLLAFISFIIYACGTTDPTPSTGGSVSALNCSSATFSSVAKAGTAYTATATLPYTGGNGAAFTAGSAIASTGVTGLSATLAAGTLATGAGSATFAITGTPSSNGTASFAISLGGQTCTLSLTVAAANTASGNAGLNITTDLANIVKFADAFKATLSSSQQSRLQLVFSKTDAAKWSNLPQALSKNRVGLASSTFSTAQWTAFYNLLKATTGTGMNEGNAEMIGILAADDWLKANGGGSDYGSGNYYIAFLGTPSTTGLWTLQFGGHHGTNIYTYNGGKLSGTTPSFRSTEPFPDFTQAGIKYQPLVQEIEAFSAMLNSLSAAEQTTAKRASTQNDIQLGPGKDGVFPTTKTGLKVGSLSATQKAAVVAAIKTYTDDVDDVSAKAILAKYTAELDNTYISFAGSTALTTKGDYVLIDGPSVWIEFNMQGGIVVRTANHPHSVWRDRTGDYGGN